MNTTKTINIQRASQYFLAALVLAGGMLAGTQAEAARVYYNSQPYHSGGWDRDGWNHDGRGPGGRDRDDRDDHGRWQRHDTEVVFNFHDDDREVIRDYMRRNYVVVCKGNPYSRAGEHCFKKGHGPRQQVRYIIGEPLPPTIVYREVPETLRVRLTPPPQGYRYVRVDDDVLLMSEAGKKIIDAVALLSAVDNH